MPQHDKKVAIRQTKKNKLQDHFQQHFMKGYPSTTSYLHHDPLPPMMKMNKINLHIPFGRHPFILHIKHKKV